MTASRATSAGDGHQRGSSSATVRASFIGTTTCTRSSLRKSTNGRTEMLWYSSTSWLADALDLPDGDAAHEHRALRGPT